MEPQALAYRSIVFDPTGVAEVSGKRQTSFVRRDEIEHLTLAHGTKSEHPGRESLYGGVILLIAVMCFEHDPWASAFCLLIAAWIFHHAHWPQFYVLVQAKGHARRLTFKGRVDRYEVGAFLARAAATYGYSIHSIVHDVTIPKPESPAVVGSGAARTGTA